MAGARIECSPCAFHGAVAPSEPYKGEEGMIITRPESCVKFAGRHENALVLLLLLAQNLTVKAIADTVHTLALVVTGVRDVTGASWWCATRA
jgi:hypothetical protein